MKVAIVTLVGNYNFGNRLQNYALQSVLEKRGVKVETLKFDKEHHMKSIFKSVLVVMYKKCTFFQNDVMNSLLRLSNFKDFTEKYIVQSDQLIPCDYDSFRDEYDCYVVGSDQVWNPNTHLPKAYFLNFTKKTKIAYAASIGVEECSEEWICEIAEAIKDYKGVSVRELSAKTMLEKYSDKDICHVLDPTMLISVDEWKGLMKVPTRFDKGKKYIFVYYIGENDVSTVNKVKDALEINGETIEIIDIMKRSDRFLYTISPSEFLFLIYHAEFICTDSFHGTVFSILFNKEFVASPKVDRATKMNMFTRFNSLLELLGLLERTSIDNILSNNEISKIDYTNCNLKLKKEIEKSQAFIDEHFS